MQKILILILIIGISLLNESVSNANHLSYKRFYHSYKDSYSNTNSQHQNNRQRVLLISLNGFRHDFIQAYNLENMAKLVSEGSVALYLNPQFSTETLPNHWSMITGSNVETHGIIADNFYDPLYKEHFTKDKTELKWWNSSEPIWSTAVKQGVKTCVYDWPGSNVVFEGTKKQNSSQNVYHKKLPFHTNFKFRAKLNQGIKFLLKENYKFISIFHDQPDQIAHKYGINSPEFNVTLEQLDRDIGYMIQRLKDNQLYESKNFNLLLVSSQGMVNIKKIVFINEYLLETDAEIWSFSQSLIHLKPLIDLNTLLMKLSRIPGVSVTIKENLPDRLLYKSNRRVAEVVVSAVEGVGFMYMNSQPFKISNNGQITQFRLTYNQKKQLMMAAADRATHGYDNLYPNMRGIFIARGAMFKKNFVSNKHIENVDVYPLLCHTLNIQCEPRNASLYRVRQFFKHSHRINKNSGNKRNFYNKHISGAGAGAMGGGAPCTKSTYLIYKIIIFIISIRIIFV